MKLIVTAGGTGGHIYPALALIEKFKAMEKDCVVKYIGTHNRMEKDIVPALGIDYVPLEIYGISKRNLIRNIKNIFLIKKAQHQCLNLMHTFQPDVVIGVGGYVTYPVLKVAHKLRIKTFIHEQNSIPGKTNRFLARQVDLVGISFEKSRSYFKQAKQVLYTGNPAGSRALMRPKITKKELGFKPTKKLIVMVAGSLGSSTFNRVMKEFLFLSAQEDYQVLYITGSNYYDEFMKGAQFSSNIIVKPYFENLTGIMKDADLFISRAGAGAIAESLALEIPSIFIPSPYVADNHQYYNALELKVKKAGVLLEEKNLTASKLLNQVKKLLNDSLKYQKLKANIKKMNPVASADLIYRAIKDLLKC